MGLLNLVTVGQEQDGNFWTKNPIISNCRVTKLRHGGTGTIWHGKKIFFGPKNPIISNRRTGRYYGIKQDPGRRYETESLWG